jgi:mRNA interferase MazF
MRKGDIVLVNFPFSDLSQTKLRPALIVAIPGGSNILLSQISTKKRAFSKHGVFLPKSACEGDIRFDSHIHADVLFTLHKNLVRRTIGKVNTDVRSQVTKKVVDLFQK